MKKVLLALVLLLTGTCALAKSANLITFPLPGDSVASTRLQADTLQSVIQSVYLTSKCEDIRKYSVADTMFTKDFTNYKTNKEGKIISGKWGETWVIKACGKYYAVPIDFDQQKNKGTDFYIDTSSIKEVRKAK